MRRVVSASGINRHDHVLEVGPGLGSLTLALLDRGARVTAVEIDPVLAGQLPHTVAEHSHSEINRLSVLHSNVLDLRRTDLEDQPTALVANLPYNVAVPALLHLLAELPSVRTVMVMVCGKSFASLSWQFDGLEPSSKHWMVTGLDETRLCAMTRSDCTLLLPTQSIRRSCRSAPTVRTW